MLFQSIMKRLTLIFDTWPEVNTHVNRPGWMFGLELLSPDEAIELITIARQKGLTRSVVGSVEGSIYSKKRTSEEVCLFDEDTPLAKKIRHAAAMLTDKPIEHAEHVQVVRYLPGQAFEEHHDYIHHPDIENHYTGKRLGSFIVYLNHDYNEGRTIFSRIGLTVSGRTGKALFFKNYINGEANEASLHQGEKVDKGEKWIAVTFVTEQGQFEYIDT